MTMEKKFSCGNCKSLHDGHDRATECCPPEEAWECTECGDWTDEKQEKCNACGK